MRPVTETRSKENTASNFRTDAHKSSRTSLTGRMATAPTSDMKAKLITPPEVRTTLLLTMEHRHPTTAVAPVMELTEDRTLDMEVIPLGMTQALLMAVHLLTHLLDMANNSSSLHHPLRS
ncbi:hypothetical protein B7P43_G13646 [Cryptotermes secundus]|uniref:Uncharacterized protein n=1 Tax=Cryptotermes secundus TaxID=105785 RepID=A0A2J7QUR7_9NEOP|nr:hypothetical protein B7P43_G13646 [Cryptotermes secundus]